MAQIAIVGNGPSRNLYRPFRGDVSVCNIPQIDIHYDYITVIDRKAAEYINNNNLKFDKPILVGEDLKNTIKTTTSQVVFEKKLMNNAATAAYHYAKTYDTIWLFGCDALWSKDCSSSQDLLIPRPARQANLHNRWREYWKEVWATGKRFVIVCPKDTEEINYGENVVWNPAKT